MSIERIRKARVHLQEVDLGRQLITGRARQMLVTVPAEVEPSAVADALACA